MLAVALVLGLGLAALWRGIALAGRAGDVILLGAAAASGVGVTGIWLRSGLRRDFVMTRGQQAIVLGGQLASVIAMSILFAAPEAVLPQVAAAGFLAGFLIPLSGGMVLGARENLRDPRRGRLLASRAADVLRGEPPPNGPVQ